jgi:site-specific DNA-methyltransferase (adenine-specific)
MATAIEDSGFEIRDQIMWIYGSGFPKSIPLFNGIGSSLKPAHEPIVMARKPIAAKNIVDNIIKYNVGGINVDICRVEESLLTSKNVIGRYPANIIHDGSEEVEKEFSKFGEKKTGSRNGVKKARESFCSGAFREKSRDTKYNRVGDIGTASRFFYCAKASKSERGLENNHPTVKPLELMKYLCRLISPKDGVILDPFMGSGTTGLAAISEGFKFIGIEKESSYMDICRKRISK